MPACLRMIPAFVVATLTAQDPYQGNGVPSAFVGNSPAIVGGTLTIQFGSPTTPVPIALLGLSDLLSPLSIPGFGNIGIDPFRPAFQLLAFGLDPSGHGVAATTLPPGFPSPGSLPLFLNVITLETAGFSISKAVRLDWANADGWEQVQALGTARQLHTATALGAGPLDNTSAVLICGGATGSIILPVPMDSAELFSPVQRSVAPLPPMSLPRASHRALRLNDGRVLITGGVTTNGVVTPTCEFFDPATMSFVPAPPMSAARAGHAMTLLADGRVLVSGGVADWQNAAVQFVAVLNSAQNTAELYDPVFNVWVPLPAMDSRRFGHSQTLLQNGQVLVVSGISGGTQVIGGTTVGEVPVFTGQCQLFDPATLTFSAVAPLGGLLTTVPARAFHGASLLPNGHVFLSGGLIQGTSSVGIGATLPTGSCAEWDGANWLLATGLPVPVAFHTHVPHAAGALIMGGFTGDLTALLPSDQVAYHAITAGALLAPIGTDHGTGTPQPRGTHTCTPLQDGTYLIYGGGFWPNTLSDGWIYTPQ